RMHLVELAERLRGVERARVKAEGRIPERRDAYEADVGRLLLGPALEVRLEGVTVRAAVPEDFGHLDLIGARARGLSGRQPLVVDAELEALRRRGLLDLVEPRRGGAVLGSEGSLVVTRLETAARIRGRLAGAACGEGQQPKRQQETV